MLIGIQKSIEFCSTYEIPQLSPCYGRASTHVMQKCSSVLANNSIWKSNYHHINDSFLIKHIRIIFTMKNLSVHLSVPVYFVPPNKSRNSKISLNKVITFDSGITIMLLGSPINPQIATPYMYPCSSVNQRVV